MGLETPGAARKGTDVDAAETLLVDSGQAKITTTPGGRIVPVSL